VRILAVGLTAGFFFRNFTSNAPLYSLAHTHTLQQHRGTVSGVQRLGHTANRGVASVSRYLGRTSVARAAAATFAEVGRFASDRTREALDQAALRLAKAGRKPPPPENGCVLCGESVCAV